MLSKLIKYDFKAVMKFWWIAAAVSVLLSMMACVGLRLVSGGRSMPAIIIVMVIITVVVAIFGCIALGVFYTIIAAIRFYKNLFSDEGYLTFTLPVKRISVLNSKLIVTMLFDLLTSAVIFFNGFLMIAGVDGFFKEGIPELFEGIKVLIENLRMEELLGWSIVWLVEVFAILFAASALSILFLDTCITFGSTVAKRGKVIVSIGIYYGATNVLAYIIQIFNVFAFPSLTSWLGNIATNTNTAALLVCGMLFVAFAFVAMLCCGLYLLLYWMIDRKLNLA